MAVAMQFNLRPGSEFRRDVRERAEQMALGVVSLVRSLAMSATSSRVSLQLLSAAANSKNNLMASL